MVRSGAILSWEKSLRVKPTGFNNWRCGCDRKCGAINWDGNDCGWSRSGGKIRFSCGHIKFEMSVRYSREGIEGTWSLGKEIIKSMRKDGEESWEISLEESPIWRGLWEAEERLLEFLFCSFFKPIFLHSLLLFSLCFVPYSLIVVNIHFYIIFHCFPKSRSSWYSLTLPWESSSKMGGVFASSKWLKQILIFLVSLLGIPNLKFMEKITQGFYFPQGRPLTLSPDRNKCSLCSCFVLFLNFLLTWKLLRN